MKGKVSEGGAEKDVAFLAYSPNGRVGPAQSQKLELHLDLPQDAGDRGPIELFSVAFSSSDL